MSEKRIAIIGCGVAGLSAIKSCLEEGLTPVCLERESDLGGVWQYCEERTEKTSCMKAMTSNSCKEMNCFSDMPFPEEDYPLLHNTRVIEYLRAYAEKHDLLKYVLFNQRVTKIYRSFNYKKTGRWEVAYSSTLEEGKMVEDTFEGVMLCTGLYGRLLMPIITGLASFQGSVMHSKDYRTAEKFKDKTVLVVGLGPSAADIATDLSPLAKRVHLSCRRGAWIVPICDPSGTPNEFKLSSRFVFSFLEGLPSVVADRIYGLLVKMTKSADHKVLGLEPTHWSRMVMHDLLLPNILGGQIVLRPGINRFEDKEVVFRDGTTEEIDAVILATGYKKTGLFPYLEEGVVHQDGEWLKLFKRIFPPDEKHNTLAVIGMAELAGSVFPIVEIQARLAAAVFKGTCTLPSAQKMREDIEKEERHIKKLFARADEPSPLSIDAIRFKDEIAELIGCKPPIGGLLLKDPRLALKCVFGPCTPYQYRLTGPHAWEGARAAILTQDERIVAAFRSREADKGK